MVEEEYDSEELGIVERRDPMGKIMFGIIFIVGDFIATAFFTIPTVVFYAVIGIGILILLTTFFVIIKQYERAVVLRWGKYSRSMKEGIAGRIPFVDGVYVVDIREKVRSFKSEEMLTKDNVPVSVDSILKYKVDPDKVKESILNVEDFDQIIIQTSQTSLRSSIGSADLQEIISEREKVNESLKKSLEKETKAWGVITTGVEVRNVKIPKELENAMSMKAQALREKDARVIYGESEVLVAKQFLDASKIYEDNQIAYALRQSNLLYESMKAQGNTTILVPSESLNHVGFGNLGIVQAFMESIEKNKKIKKSEAK